MTKSNRFSFFYTGWLSVLLVLGNAYTIAQPTVVKVACVGNSVTFGYGLKNREATAYPAVLQRLLGAKYIVKNFGHSGATVLRNGHNPYYKTKSFEEAVAFAPDIAVIHLGLNDTDPRNWPNYRDEFAADYAWLIDTLRKSNPAMQVYVCRLTPIFHDHSRFTSGTRDWFWQIQELLPKIAAANNTNFIDLHSPLYAHPDFFPDALHPNEEGASVLANTVYQKITGDFGGLKLPAVFASRMVIQRDQPVLFYGSADAGEKIRISFNGLTRDGTADNNGRWKLPFPPMKAGGPHKAIIASASRTVLLEDILIGEVWLCAGQSNMHFPLQASVNSKEVMQQAQNSPALRFLNKQPVAETDNKAWDANTLANVNQLEYFSGTWQQCDSTTAKKFSAVAYYFGQQLQKHLSVPVGLIQVAVGGSPTESWIDRYTLEHHPVLVNELYNWRKSDFFLPWVRERTDTNLKHSNVPKQRHPYEPAYNFEAGIAPFTSFPIRGVIWYQGESNAHNIELHEVAFKALVKSWRKQWGYAFPFYYVQLSSLNRASWPSFRYSQLQLLQQIPNAGMAVSSDVGDPNDVHPRRKKEVGERLAKLALHFTYGFRNIVAYGPMPLKAARARDSVVVSFRYAGLRLNTRNGAPLKGFTAVNDKGIITEVKAIIRSDKVIIPLKREEKVSEIRYGWKPYTEANLINKAGLPASTFKLVIQ
jgi:sialate O-acetylesterase